MALIENKSPLEINDLKAFQNKNVTNSSTLFGGIKIYHWIKMKAFYKSETKRTDTKLFRVITPKDFQEYWTICSTVDYGHWRGYEPEFETSLDCVIRF